MLLISISVGKETVVQASFMLCVRGYSSAL
ncbi:Uncharacterised protein [Segatella copri]|nr:Uncharacterised protein [Segatella copri]